MLLGDLDSGFLEHDDFGQILEELVKLYKCSLDLLDVVVASTDCAEDARCSSDATRSKLCEYQDPVSTIISRPTYCCLENTFIAPVCLSCFVNLGIVSVGIDNAVLPCNLVLI